MLDRLIAFSLNNRLLVLVAAGALVAWGGYQATRLPVDVFPDLNRPTVAVLTELSESPGLPPEDVEALVTRPLEALLNGAAGVRRVRSTSTTGLSIVWVEFDWNEDAHRARQVVAERLGVARGRLPRDAVPILAPMSSIMGEVRLLGLRPITPATDTEGHARQMMELRTFAEWSLRPRLQAVEGVAQVTVLGGVLQQYQVLTSPGRLAAAGVTLDQLTEAAERASALAGGGVLQRHSREALVRFEGRAVALEEIARTPVVWRGGHAVLIEHVADVRFGGPSPRGDGGLWARGDDQPAPAIILSVQKQPHANTLALDAQLDRVLDEIDSSLPAGSRLDRQAFRQAEFIRTAVDNVLEAIRDGALWVFVLLLLFLGNLRTSVVTLTALPLSLILTALVFHAFGVSINTMTLGGLAVAIGELVDDAIVDVENIHRRLREAAGRGKLSVLEVVRLASIEVRGSIVHATLVVCLVVLPLFALGGLEGRLFAPLGLAYVVSLLASLVVSLTVTPALASVVLPGGKSLARREPLLLRALLWLDEKVVRFSLRHARAVLAGVAVLVVLSLAALAGMGGEFLPIFEEGTLTVNLQAEPGTSLAESRRLADRALALLRQVPEVESVARRTGRAENDEHAEGLHSSELEVRLAPARRPREGKWAAVLRSLPLVHSLGTEPAGRPRPQVRAEIEQRLQALAGVRVGIGQPISHRLDHVLSGVRAQVAVKLFGPDLRLLRERAQDVQRAMGQVPGVVDLQIEPQAEVPQLRLEFDRERAQAVGLRPGDVARFIETALAGRVVGQVAVDEARFDVVVRFDDASRQDTATLAALPLTTPSGRKIRLDEVARPNETTGPNQLGREQVQRRLVVSCNVRGRDLAGAVEEIQRRLRPIDEALRAQPGGYRIEYGGQYEAQQEANRRLLLLGLLSVAGVLVILYKALSSWRAALQVLVNVPLAALGAVVALVIANRPGAAELAAAPWWAWPAVWLRATTLSLAHWVGFITLVGIVSRNGILMISRYLHLLRDEKMPFSEALIVRGTLERLAPVLLTAGVAVIGLVPLALGSGEAGKEVLHPLAVVVIGGLVASTLLDQVVTPALFWLWGQPEAHSQGHGAKTV